MRMGGSMDDTWAPDLQVRNGRKQICGKGWRKFVTDNKLKPDDICLFNLRKNTKTLTMDVHIIRKRSVQLHCMVSVTASELFVPMLRSVKMSGAFVFPVFVR
jgi:hypothetical protein